MPTADHDGELDEQAPPELSRSRRRSEAIAYTELAEQLVRSKRIELPTPPFDAELRAALLESRRLSKSARSRQIRRLAQLLRGAGEIAQLHDALAGRTPEAAAVQALEHANETWRTRLLDEGDLALAELIATHPGADRMRLRQLMRQARRSPPDARAKRATTVLLRLVRETRTQDVRVEAPRQAAVDDASSDKHDELRADLRAPDELAEARPLRTPQPDDSPEL